MATLVSNGGTTYLGNLNGPGVQTITADNWLVTSISFRLAGAGTRQVKVTVNGVDSNTVTVPGQTNQFTFTFPTAVFCDGLTSFTLNSLDGTTYVYGTNSSAYAGGTWLGSPTNDLNFVVSGRLASSLVTRPDAGDNQTAIDGYVRGASNTSGADARDQSSGDIQSATDANNTLSWTATGGSPAYVNNRPFFNFDTSGLSGGTPLSASLVLNSTFGTGGTIGTVALYAYNPADPGTTALSDFGTKGSTKLSDDVTPGTGDRTFTLNAAGLAYLNTEGITSFCLRSSVEIAGSNPVGDNFYSVNFSDTAGTDSDPELTIYYSPPAGITDALFFGAPF
jgi:hypothetical protein